MIIRPRSRNQTQDKDNARGPRLEAGSPGAQHHESFSADEGPSRGQEANISRTFQCHTWNGRPSQCFNPDNLQFINCTQNVVITDIYSKSPPRKHSPQRSLGSLSISRDCLAPGAATPFHPQNHHLPHSLSRNAR